MLQTLILVNSEATTISAAIARNIIAVGGLSHVHAHCGI